MSGFGKITSAEIIGALGFTPAATAISPIPNGTAAAPGAGFVGDAATGIYRPGGGQFGVALGGVSYAVMSFAAGLMLANDTSGLNQTPRKKLTASTTFYVRSDGSDSNNGLADTAGGAFLTLQGAINYLKSSIDFNRQAVTLQVRTGTYAGFTINGPFVGENDTGLFNIVGDEVTPANVIIAGTSTNAVRIYSTAIKLRGLTLQTTTNGVGLLIGGCAYVEHQNLRFGNCAQEMINVTTFSMLFATGPTTVTGNADSFLHATHNSRVSFEGQTVTFSGGPAFATYVVGINNAWVSFASGTVTGSKTGQTYVHIGGVLNLSSMTGYLYGTDHAPVMESGGIIVAASPLNTLYVRSDGSDNNDGSANDASHAFATIAAAITALQKRPYDQLNSRTPTIQVGAGTWTTPVVLANVSNVDGVTLQGDTATPSNVTISLSSGMPITANNLVTPWTIKGFKLTTLSGNLLAVTNARVFHQNNDFGSSSAAQIAAQRGSYVEATGSYTISGGAPNHIYCDRGTYYSATGTVTITNTPAFSGSFARADDGSYLRASPTWSGSATGSRYNARTNSVIDSNGGGANALPGDSAGTTSTGGQYV